MKHLYNLLFLLALTPLAQAEPPIKKIPIASCQALQDSISQSDGYYVLTANIDCSNVNGTGEFEPIYTLPTAFSGVLDGQGFTISQLEIVHRDGNKHSASLFPTLVDATIKDIHFDIARIEHTISDWTTHVALIAGCATNSTFSKIKVDGALIRPETDLSYNRVVQTGGLVARSRASHYAEIELNNFSILTSTNTGTLIGTTDSEAGFDTIEDVTINNTFIFSYDGRNNYTVGAGGLIGTVDGGIKIERVTTNGRIRALAHVGGLIGQVTSSGHGSYIHHSATNTELESTEYAGGIIGKANTPVSSDEQMDLEYVYAVGFIDTKGSDAGRGVVGNHKQSSHDLITSSESYYDKQTTDKKYAGDDSSQGLKTDQMQESATYEKWPREIWHIEDDAYPTLIANKKY